MRLSLICAREFDQHDFDQCSNVVGIDKAHFQVELGKLGLAIGAQVLVAKAAGDLEIAFDAGHHEQLLELLRALGQRIKFVGMQAGWARQNHVRLRACS